MKFCETLNYYHKQVLSDCIKGINTPVSAVRNRESGVSKKIISGLEVVGACKDHRISSCTT